MRKERRDEKYCTLSLVKIIKGQYEGRQIIDSPNVVDSNQHIESSPEFFAIIFLNE